MRGVEAVGNQEDVDIGLDLAGEFFEHEVLILHLGAELGGLEQALAIPLTSAGRVAGTLADVDDQPFVQECYSLA